MRGMNGDSDSKHYERCERQLERLKQDRRRGKKQEEELGFSGQSHEREFARYG